MRFCDIPGHEDAKDRLRSYADGGRIPHAILLEGPEGTGKHALARAFVQYVECPNRHDGDSCGVCASCRQHQAMQHIDTLYSFPYVKRKSATTTVAGDYMHEFIEFVKESPYMDRSVWLEKLGSPNTKPIIYVDEAMAIIRSLSFATHNSKYKAVILWQADRLHETAANKLLKIIEEPPGSAIIVMTTDNPLNVLPTIYSRTQRIKILPLPDDTVAEWMVNELGAEPETAAGIAPLAQGSLTAAKQLLSNSTDTAKFLEQFIKLMRLAYQRDIGALKTWSNDLATEKRDTLVDFLEYMARMLRENFMANFHDASLNLMTPDEANFGRNFSRFIHERNVVPLYEAVNEAIADIRANVNTKLVLFDLSITVILLLK